MNMLSPLDDRTRKQINLIAAQSGGSRTSVDKAIRKLAVQDHEFLLGLVQPFLDGIVAHALSTALPQPARTAVSPSLSASALDDLVKGMRAGLERGGPAPSQGQGDSAAHANTIRALAAAQARRRKEDY